MAARRRRSRARRFADPAMYDVELAIGPTTVDPESDADWRELWGLRGEAILASWAALHPGRRPWAWWRFEAREDQPPAGCESQRLVELGVLHGDELLRSEGRDG